MSFIIRIKVEDGKPAYFGMQEAANGLPVFVDAVWEAYRFKSKHKAKQVLQWFIKLKNAEIVSV